MKTLKTLLAGTDLTPPDYSSVTNPSPPLMHLGPIRVEVSVVYTDGFGRRQCDQTTKWHQEGEYKVCGPAWNGSLEQLAAELAKWRPVAMEYVSQPHPSLAGTPIPSGGMGYAIVSLNREWLFPWGQPTDSAVYVTVIGDQLIVRPDGWDEWLAALDAAHAAHVACHA